MLRRLLAEFIRWLVDKWEKGEIDKAKKEEEWDEQTDAFKDAAKKWRKKR